MIDLSQKSAVLVDHGFFIELALRLARDFGTIYYVDPSWETAQTKVDHAITGDGYAGELIRVKEIWDVIDKVDLAVFPDTGHAGMQLFIEKHVQCPVWGSRRADKLEIEKLAFKKLQEKLGMKFAEYDVIDGLDALREYCQDPKNDDRWIKGTPQFRGCFDDKTEILTQDGWKLVRCPPLRQRSQLKHRDWRIGKCVNKKTGKILARRLNGAFERPEY
jgi:hypothetical protein